jgi:predicted P-loop ATPase
VTTIEIQTYLDHLKSLNGDGVAQAVRDAQALALLSRHEQKIVIATVAGDNKEAASQIRSAIRDAQKSMAPPVSERIYGDIVKWGYDLWLNDLDDGIMNGDEPMTDTMRSQLYMAARDAGYAEMRLLSALTDAIVALAARRRRHPLREFFAVLPAWDGKDHIGGLAKYFIDKHDPITYADGTQRSVLHAFLLRWLCGAIAKIHGNQNAIRANTMLVLAAKQGLGKSHFAAWISPSPIAYVEKQITPDDKDCRLLRAKTAVWEVGELAATTKRRDVDELKSFITETAVTERKAYGRFDIQKPNLCSYIGSVNPDGSGFLADPTGNRRFAVVELEVIAHDYAVDIDQRQVWAQALALWRADPFAYMFSPEEVLIRDANAEAETEADVYADMIARVFDVDPENSEVSTSSSEMMDKLRTYAGLAHGNEKVQGRDLARSMYKMWGIKSKRSNGRTMYQGVTLKAGIGS